MGLLALLNQALLKHERQNEGKARVPRQERAKERLVSIFVGEPNRVVKHKEGRFLLDRLELRESDLDFGPLAHYRLLIEGRVEVAALVC